MFGRIDHIGVAVADLDAALALHERTYGMPVAHRETVPEQGVEAVLLDVGESHVELLAPLADDTPVGRFLAGAAPACTTSPTAWRTSSRRSRSCASSGVRLIDERPRIGIRGSRVAFLHPSAGAGVLTELVQPATFQA